MDALSTYSALIRTLTLNPFRKWLSWRCFRHPGHRLPVEIYRNIQTFCVGAIKCVSCRIISRSTRVCWMHAKASIRGEKRYCPPKQRAVCRFTKISPFVHKMQFKANMVPIWYQYGTKTSTKNCFPFGGVRW